MTDAGTAPDDPSSLPPRGRLHTNAQALRGGVAEMFGETAEHSRAAYLELCRPGGMAHRDHKFLPANEPGLDLSGDVRPDYFLPATRDATEHQSVFHAPLVKQLAQGVTYRYRSTQAGALL